MPILQSIQRIIVAPDFGAGWIDAEAEAAASPSAKPFRYAASRRRFSSPFAIGGMLLILRGGMERNVGQSEDVVCRHPIEGGGTDNELNSRISSTNLQISNL
jgi:hypothetical protein